MCHDCFVKMNPMILTSISSACTSSLVAASQYPMFIMSGSKSKYDRDQVNRNSYKWKLNRFEKEIIADVNILRDKINQDKLKIKRMKQSMSKMTDQINIRDQTIVDQAVTLQNRANLIEIQRAALRTNPQSVIDLIEHNTQLQDALDCANDGMRRATIKCEIITINSHNVNEQPFIRVLHIEMTAIHKYQGKEKGGNK